MSDRRVVIVEKPTSAGFAQITWLANYRRVAATMALLCALPDVQVVESDLVTVSTKHDGRVPLAFHDRVTNAGINRHERRRRAALRRRGKSTC